MNPTLSVRNEQDALDYIRRSRGKIIACQTRKIMEWFMRRTDLNKQPFIQTRVVDFKPEFISRARILQENDERFKVKNLEDIEVIEEETVEEYPINPNQASVINGSPKMNKERKKKKTNQKTINQRHRESRSRNGKLIGHRSINTQYVIKKTPIIDDPTVMCDVQISNSEESGSFFLIKKVDEYNIQHTAGHLYKSLNGLTQSVVSSFSSDDLDPTADRVSQIIDSSTPMQFNFCNHTINGDEKKQSKEIEYLRSEVKKLESQCDELIIASDNNEKSYKMISKRLQIAELNLESKEEECIKLDAKYKKAKMIIKELKKSKPTSEDIEKKLVTNEVEDIQTKESHLGPITSLSILADRISSVQSATNDRDKYRERYEEEDFTFLRTYEDPD
jgi:hypothetical protein